MQIRKDKEFLILQPYSPGGVKAKGHARDGDACQTAAPFCAAGGLSVILIETGDHNPTYS